MKKESQISDLVGSSKVIIPYQLFYPQFSLIQDRTNAKNINGFLDTLHGKNKEIERAFIYIHIPFCKQACCFCDFNKVFSISQVHAYVQEVKRELVFFAEQNYVRSLRIQYIHFGGGTPSCIPPEELSDILHTIHVCFPTENARVSIECAPSSAKEETFLRFLSDYSVNRVSVGVQTFSEELRRYCTIESQLEDVYTVLSTLKKMNLETSADLLYGFPVDAVKEDEMNRLMRDLKEAKKLDLDSIEMNLLYPFQLIKNKKMCGPFPNSQQLQKTQTQMRSMIKFYGWQQISDFSYRKSNENLVFEQMYYGMGETLPQCIGIGCSSFGSLGGYRYKNVGFSAYMQSDIKIALLKKLTERQIQNQRVFGFSKRLCLIKDVLNEKHFSGEFADKVQQLISCSLLEDKQNGFLELTNAAKSLTDNILIYMIDDDEKESLLKNSKFFNYS